MIAQFQLDYGEFQLAVDVELPDTGITVLFGQSGSGKTTLLRCIAGLQRATQGFFSIKNHVWQDSSQQLFLPTHQRALGYIFQDANLFAHLTVHDNLRYGLKRLGKELHDTALLELLGIEHLLTRMPANLSGGEKQRVAIARALLLQPDLLLMDEPLAALDMQRKQELLPFLSRLPHELNIPMLYVTHAQAEVAQLADYLVLLEQGKVVTAGNLTDTLSRLDLHLATERHAVSVWQVMVLAHEDDYQLTRVGFDGGELSIPAIAAPIGTALRLQIEARDVSISLEIAKATSILNILPAIITDMTHEGGQRIVRLQVGTLPLLAHITQKSAVLLNLTIGMAVYVQIKGTSLLN